MTRGARKPIQTTSAAPQQNAKGSSTAAAARPLAENGDGLASLGERCALVTGIPLLEETQGEAFAKILEF